MADLFASGKFTATNDAGAPLAGGKLFSYAAGTLTPLATFTTQAGNIANANPAILDSAGRANVWLGPLAYRLILKTSADVTLWDTDNVLGSVASVDLSASTGSSLVGWIRAAISSVAATVSNRLSWLPFNAFEFMTVAQIADCQAYTYSLNLTAPVQAAMNAAYLAGRDLYCPAGGYLVTGLQIPGTNNNPGKASRFRIFGDSYGEVGVIALKNRGTVLFSVTNAPILNYTATVAGNGSGEVEIDRLALYGASATPVVLLDSFYGLSSFHHCNLYQGGIGNGIQVNWGATYDIHHCYIAGASYAATGYGASRTGIGIYIAQGTGSGGLQTIRQCTSAGWHTAMQVGVIGGLAYAYAPHISMSEVSYCFYGIRLSGQCEGALVSGCYFEGQDGGAMLLDEGNYNRVKDCFFFFSNGSLGGYTMLSSTTPAKFGSRYEGNTFYLFNIANTIGLDLTSNAVSGGPGKVASRNHFLLSAGTAGVIGLRINGVDPRIEATSNDFQPAGAWTGTGTFRISNTSTSGDGTAGTGIFGLTQSRSQSDAIVVPALGRGAINLTVDPTALNNTNITAGVLTIGELSAFTLTPTVGVAITQIAAPNLPDKTFSLHVTATAFSVTFTNGALLKMSGSANLVTGANGAWVTFQVKPGGVVWETSRIIY